MLMRGGGFPRSEAKIQPMGGVCASVDATTTPAARAEVASAPSSDTLFREMLRSPWRMGVIQLLGGLAYAAVMACVWQITADGSLRLVRTLFLMWTYLWPLVLVLRLVAGSTRRTRIVVGSIYFAILTTLGGMALIVRGTTTPGQLAYVWTSTNVPPTLLMLVFLNRRVRAVGPLVIAFTVVAMLGANVALWLARPEDGLAFVSAAATGIVPCGVLGAFGLIWLRRRYERGQVSDQSLMIDALWLVFGVVQSMELVFSGTVWLLAGAGALLVHKLVNVGLVPQMGRYARVHTPAVLLLLRVFSLGRRSERLFDALTTHWRYIGPVRLIAGPDLATTTVEPHEFLDFVIGRLGRRFIDGSEALERRLTETRPFVDRDGRFRVGEFFCHDDTWRTVLARLTGGADAVLMDVRDFGRTNAGCVFELQALVNVVPLARITLVYDHTTDRLFLDETLREAWDGHGASANRDAPLEALKLVLYEGSGALPLLLRTLCAAAGFSGAKARALA